MCLETRCSSKGQVEALFRFQDGDTVVVPCPQGENVTGSDLCLWVDVGWGLAPAIRAVGLLRSPWTSVCLNLSESTCGVLTSDEKRRGPQRHSSAGGCMLQTSTATSGGSMLRSPRSTPKIKRPVTDSLQSLQAHQHYHM